MAGGWKHGRSVVDGQLRSLSPTSIKTGDPNSEGGCLRKWWLQYIAKQKPPQTEAMKKGDVLHAELERYLKTGTKDLSALALAGLHMLPTPGPDLRVEFEAIARFEDPDLASIPMICRVDLAHRRGVNHGATDIGDTHDPPNTIEVHDHKTSANIARYGKTPDELGRDLQMVACGVAVLSEDPALDFVRLSHGYFQTRGRARTEKSSILLPRETVLDRWKYANGVARSIRDVAKVPLEAGADAIDANLSACADFGGCWQREQGNCSAGMTGGLKAFFPSAVIQEKEKGQPVSSVTDKINQARADRDAAYPREFRDLYTEYRDLIAKLNKGTPAFTGKLAEYAIAYANCTPEELAGSGEFGAATLGTMQDLKDALAEMREMAGTSAPPTLLPPDAPPPDPALASAGPEGKDPTKKRGRPKKASEIPAHHTRIETIVPTPEIVARDGRVPTPEHLPVQITLSKTESDEQVTIPVSSSGAGFAVFVDCVPSIPHDSLNPWVQSLADEISKHAGCDLRAAQEKPLAFGGWRGVLAMYVRERALPHGDASGTYTLDARGSEIMEVAAEALRARAALFCRGIR